MLNRNKRDENKSKGPWGMHDFNIEYRKMGETMHRHRFVSAPSKEGAVEQFNFIMEKAAFKGVEIIEITESPS